MAKIRVLLVDDHSLFREGLANILNAQPDFQVIGEASDGLEAQVKALKLEPDLILMDVGMPGCDGVEATQKISQLLPEATIVMLTVRDEDEKLFEAIKNGAQGYLLKSIRSHELVSLLRGAVQGEDHAFIALGLARAGQLAGSRRMLYLARQALERGLRDLAEDPPEYPGRALAVVGRTAPEVILACQNGPGR